MTNLDKNNNHENISVRLLNLILDMPVDEQLKLLNMLDKSEYSGSRKHKRKQLPLPVNLGTEKISSNNFIKDISKGGVFIETGISLSIGEELSLIFKLPNNNKFIKATGLIVRTNELGIGIKFKRLTR